MKKIVIVCEPKSMLVRLALFKELMPNGNIIERKDYCSITTETHNIVFVSYKQIALMGRKDQIFMADYVPSDIINEIIIPCELWRSNKGAYGEFLKT